MHIMLSCRLILLLLPAPHTLSKNGALWFAGRLYHSPGNADPLLVAGYVFAGVNPAPRLPLQGLEDLACALGRRCLTLRLQAMMRYPLEAALRPAWGHSRSASTSGMNSATGV